MIEQYISELLFRYDSVILPGFGAFVLKDSPSTIHPVENKISPPAKFISFDPALKNNDGILANYLSEKEKISFFDACSVILEFVEKTNRALNEGKEIILDKIGKLSKSNDVIAFVPDTAINYNPDTFGMEEIISSPILRDEVKIKMQEQYDNKLQIAKARRSFPKVAVWLTIIVVLLGGTTGAIFIIKPDFITNLNLSELFSKSENKGNTIAMNQQNKNDKPATKTIAHTSDSIAPDSSAQQNSTDTNTRVTQAVSGRFYVISASFKIQSNAENFSRTLRQKQYDSQVISVPEKGMFVVSYNSFATLDEAQQALTTIRNSENASAWILNK